MLAILVPILAKLLPGLIMDVLGMLAGPIKTAIQNHAVAKGQAAADQLKGTQDALATDAKIADAVVAPDAGVQSDSANRNRAE